MPILLILGAFVVIVTAVLILLWMYLDGKISQGGRSVIQKLTARLEEAENEVADLRRRVEDLETIASNED